MPFYRGGFIDTPDIDRRRRENGRASQGRESARIERGCDSYMLIQKDIDLETINSYRTKYTGMSYTEIPNIRIDIYSELNKMFIISNKNKLYLEIIPIDKIKDEGFRIEKVRILGTCIYMLVYKFGENEKHKNTIIKKGINLSSLILNNRTGCIEKIV